MNNILKFSIGILTTLGLAWLAFVVGASRQFGDLSPESEILEDDGSRPADADLFPKDISGLAKQGAEDYLALGCFSCHTQQVRLVEAGFDVERGWGKRPSMPRDYVLQDHVMIGNTRIGPDLANFGLRENRNNWLHQHLYEPQSVVSDSICPPSPFLYETTEEAKEGSIEIPPRQEGGQPRHVIPSFRANRIVAYLKSLNQDYELPEMTFIETETEEADAQEITTDSNASAVGVPEWLAEQISSGQQVYMSAGSGGGMCFTCHQSTGLGLTGQFPPLVESDWVLGDKDRLIKISLFGLMGEIEVNGVKYNGAMPPPGIPPGSLTDQQVADVLTYIRNSWGNSASAVTPHEVATVRDSIKGRAPMQMWTAAELASEKKPEK